MIDKKTTKVYLVLEVDVNCDSDSDVFYADARAELAVTALLARSCKAMNDSGGFEYESHGGGMIHPVVIMDDQVADAYEREKERS